MKAIILLGLCALAVAIPPTPAPVKWVPKKYQITEKPLLEKHIQILDLIKDINQEEPSKYIEELAHKYNPDNYGTIGKYYWEHFLHHHKYDHVHEHELFSVMYPKHLKHAITLFKVFYHVEWEYIPALYAYARTHHFNKGLLGYSFLVSLVHRHDLPPMILPALYEVIPHYFYNYHVIHEAQCHYKHDEYITANYSLNHMYVDEEQHLAYFTEDVGLNNFYAMYHFFYPFWMDLKEFHHEDDHRGELFYIVHQQLWARYYSERLSHDFKPLPPLKKDTHFTPYYTGLVHPGGYPFPSRPNDAHTDWEYHHDYYNFTDVYVYDSFRRLHESIQRGFAYDKSGQKVPIYGKNGIEFFGDMVEGNPTSPFYRYYGTLQMYVRHILGYGEYPTYPVPSVVEQFSTALRDPAYWQYMKWLVDFFQLYKENSPHKFYTEQDMLFPGVEVESIHVDRLTTYFDWFDSDLSLVHTCNHSIEDSQHPYHVHVRQQRLNHKPFTYTINVESSKPHPAVVRVYIGPKYDEFGHEFELNHNRLHFFLIDKFYYHLTAGKNAILRNSKQTITVSDKTSFWQLYQRLTAAYKDNKDFIIDGSETHWGIPNRLILPIGKPGGMKYQFYVIVTPYPHTEEVGEKIPKEHYYPKVGTGSWMHWFDEKPFGFPFDQPIDPSVFYVPNSHFQDVTIYHKEFDKLNVPED